MKFLKKSYTPIILVLLIASLVFDALIYSNQPKPEGVKYGAVPVYVPTVRSVAISISLSDGTAKEKAQADYQLTGTADDVLINSIGGTGKKSMSFSSGNATLANLVRPQTASKFVGQGQQITVFHIATGNNQGAIGDNTSVYDLYMADFSIDGNKAGSTADTVMDLNSTHRGIIERVEIFNAYSKSFHASTDWTLNDFSSDLYYIDTYARDGGNSGYEVDDQASGIHYIRARAERTNPGFNAHTHNGVVASSNITYDNTLSKDSLGYGYYWWTEAGALSMTSYITAINPVATGSTLAGFEVGRVDWLTILGGAATRGAAQGIKFDDHPAFTGGGSHIRVIGFNTENNTGIPVRIASGYSDIDMSVTANTSITNYAFTTGSPINLHDSTFTKTNTAYAVMNFGSGSEGSRVTNVDASGSTDSSGIQPSANMTISTSRFHHNVSGVGSGQSNLTLNAVTTDLNSGSGIDNQGGDYWQVIGGRLVNNGTYGARLRAGSMYNSFIGVDTSDYQTVKTQDYGVYEADATADYNSFFNGISRGNTSSNVSMAGAHSVISRISGYVSENSGTVTMLANSGMIDIPWAMSANVSSIQIVPNGNPGVATTFYTGNVSAAWGTIYATTNVTSNTPIYWRAAVSVGG